MSCLGSDNNSCRIEPLLLCILTLPKTYPPMSGNLKIQEPCVEHASDLEFVLLACRQHSHPCSSIKTKNPRPKHCRGVAWLVSTCRSHNVMIHAAVNRKNTVIKRGSAKNSQKPFLLFHMLAMLCQVQGCKMRSSNKARHGANNASTAVSDPSSSSPIVQQNTKSSFSN